MGNRVLVLALVAACGGGGDHPGQPDGSTGDASSIDAPPGALCGSAACEDACGSATDACGEVVACPRCEFTGDAIATNPVTAETPVLVLGAQPAVALGSAIWTKGATWTSETPANDPITGFVVAPDGTRFIGYRDAGYIVAHDGGGTWTAETVGTNGFGDLSLAVADDGTVYAAFGGYVNGMTGLMLATRSPAGTWSYARVAQPSTLPTYVAVALIGGQPWIAWADGDDGSLRVSFASGGTFTTETVDTNVPASVDHHLAIAGDAAGNPHVAYRQNSPFQREIDHAMRIAGTWQLDKAAVMHHGNRGAVSMTAAPNGDIAIGYVDQLGAGLAVLHRGIWSRQPIAGGDDVAVAVAYDASGTLVAALNPWLGPKLLTYSGLYPADHEAACAAIAAAICPQACACDTSGGSCCYTNSSGVHGCDDPEPFCEEAIGWYVCGDASIDPAAIAACQSATTSLTCSGPEVVVPDVCPVQN